MYPSLSVSNKTKGFLLFAFVVAFAIGFLPAHEAYSAGFCEYMAPPPGCTWVQGPNYDPATTCGMALQCTGGGGSGNASLTIVKNATGGDGTFSFSVSGPTSANPSVTTSTGSGYTVVTIAAGTYSVAETVPQGWTLASVSCTVNGSSAGSPMTNGVSGISVNSGDSVNCTFDDQMGSPGGPGTLVVYKHVSGGSLAAGNFNLHVYFNGSDIYGSPAPGSETGTSYAVNPGATYSVVEDAPPSGYSASYSGNCDSQGNVVATTGTVTCTITNTYSGSGGGTGTLTINKSTTGGDGQFGFSIAGPSSTTVSVNTSQGAGTSGSGNVIAGTYTITETVPSGWTFTAANCRNVTTGQSLGSSTTDGVTGVAINSGDDVECNFSDTIQSASSASITIVKKTTGGDGSFGFIFDGPSPGKATLTTVGGTASSSAFSVSPGSYTVTETTPPSGWTLASSGCTDNGAAAGSPTSGGITSLTINSGDSVVCTFNDTSGTSNPLPTITSISPSSATAGDPGFTLTINGTNFISSSVAYWQNGVLTTTYVSSTQLTAAVPSSLIATAGTYAVSVDNPSPGGGTSNSLPFTVNNAGSGSWVITKIVTSNIVAPAFSFTITGPSFGPLNVSITPNQVCQANEMCGWYTLNNLAPGASYSATETPPTNYQQIQSDCGNVTVTNGQQSNCTVTNQYTGGSCSNPVVSQLSPSSAEYRNLPATFTVNGSNFNTDSVVVWGIPSEAGTTWNELPTTYVSSTQLTATIDANVVPNKNQTYYVGVYNPCQGTVNFPTMSWAPASQLGFLIKALQITSLNPSSAQAGDPAFTLTVGGYDFMSNSVVQWNGSNRSTSYVSGNTLTAQILASDISTAGNYPVTVYNPSTGETSNQLIFCVGNSCVSNPVPTITSISPSSATAGDVGFTLTVVGTNYISSSVVYWQNTALATNYINSTKMTAQVPASLIATAGRYYITVVNPSPGGGTSNAVSFTVKAPCNPRPTITKLVPSLGTIGDPGFTMTVSGSGFSASSVMYWGNIALSTNASNYAAGTVSAFIPSLPDAGTYYVTVVNPATCDGGTSSPTGSHPDAVAVSPDGSVFVTNYSDNTLQKFDSNLNQTDIVATGSHPDAVAVSPDGKYVFVATDGFAQKFNESNMTLVNQVALSGNAAGVAVSPDSNSIYVTVSGSSPMLVKITASNFKQSVGVSFSGDPKGVVSSLDGSHVYVTDRQNNDVQAFNASDLSNADQGSTGITPTGIAINQYDGNSLYVTAYGSNFLDMLDSSNLGNPEPTASTDSHPVAVAASSTNRYVVEVNYQSNTVAQFNIPTLSSLASAVTGSQPVAVAISPQVSAGQDYVYVVNYGSDTVEKFNGQGLQSVSLQNDGGTSNALPFTVNNPVPTVASISPGSAQAGSAAFTLDVGGSNFVPGSTVQWAGSDLTTSYLSSTKLTAQIPAADVASAGTFNITVVNATPGGGTSSPALQFAVYQKGSGTTPATSNFAVDTSSQCATTAGTRSVYLNWTFNDSDGLPESRFAIKIANATDTTFSNPVVSRYFTNLSNPPGSLNQQSVLVESPSGSDTLAFGHSYIWEVQVGEQNSATCVDATGDPNWNNTSGGCSGWQEQGSFTTPSSPGMYADFTPNPASASVNSSISFVNNSSCPGGCSYAWDFGDFNGSTQQSPAHSYGAAGTYTVTLDVYNSAGDSCRQSRQVTVCSTVAGPTPSWQEKSPFLFGLFGTSSSGGATGNCP